jgi:hypothetical protein
MFGRAKEKIKECTDRVIMVVTVIVIVMITVSWGETDYLT